MTFAAAVKNIRRIGVGAALFDALYRRIRQSTGAMLLRAVHLDPEYVCPSLRQLPAGFQGRFLSESDLLIFAEADPEYIDRNEIARALARGDRCYGILHGADLASYGWYALGPTPIAPDLRLAFSGPYVYMYNGNTRSDYRGKRLHGIGMALALDELRASEGIRGIVSYVEANNAASLRSCFRLGYRCFGTVAAVPFSGRGLLLHSAGCAKFGFQLQWIEDSQRRPDDAAIISC